MLIPTGFLGVTQPCSSPGSLGYQLGAPTPSDEVSLPSPPRLGCSLASRDQARGWLVLEPLVLVWQAGLGPEPSPECVELEPLHGAHKEEERSHREDRSALLWLAAPGRQCPHL